jgi:hypothetical protein
MADAARQLFLPKREEYSRGFLARAETGERPRDVVLGATKYKAQKNAPKAEEIPQLKLASGMGGVNQTKVQGVPQRQQRV